MKTFIALIVLAAMFGIIVWQYKVQYIALEEHKRQLQESSESGKLAVQQKCAAQARARFVQLGLVDGKSATFRSHYSTALDNCFVQIETSKPSLDTTWNNMALSETATGKLLGNYSWRSALGKDDRDVAPYTCEVSMPSGEVRTCRSADEFRNLATAYMK